MKQLSREEVLSLVELHQQGMSYQEIGERTGMSRQGVYQALQAKQVATWAQEVCQLRATVSRYQRALAILLNGLEGLCLPSDVEEAVRLASQLTGGAHDTV